METGGAALRIEHDFDMVRLMSLSAYRRTKGFWNLDQDLSGAPIEGLERGDPLAGVLDRTDVHAAERDGTRADVGGAARE